MQQRLSVPIVLLCAAVPALSQVAAAGGHELPILVDGSKTPERIRDLLAYRHLILTLAERRDAHATGVASQLAHLRPIGLSEADRTALLNSLDLVRERLDLIEKAQRDLPTVAPNDIQRLIDLKNQRDTILDEAVRRMRVALTPQGKDKLDIHIAEYVKRRITIYGQGAHH